MCSWCPLSGVKLKEKAQDMLPNIFISHLVVFPFLSFFPYNSGVIFRIHLYFLEIF